MASGMDLLFPEEVPVVVSVKKKRGRPRKADSSAEQSKPKKNTGYLAVWLRPEVFIRLMQLVTYTKLGKGPVRFSSRSKAVATCVEEYIQHHCHDLDELFKK